MIPRVPEAASFLEELKPYEDARAIRVSTTCKESILKLDCNEATYPPSPLVVKRLSAFVRREPLNWYPDTQSQDLKQALEKYVGFSSAFISTFNGCDHALETICRTFLNPGQEAVVFSPTYDNFRVFVQSAGGRVVPLFARSAFEKNVEGLREALNPKTKLVYLANPTNPTGITYSEDEIRFVLNLASSALVIVDEAYFEFWGQTSVRLVHEFPNLFITRSFSKAFALAGLRCGYAVSDPRNIQMLRKVRNGKSINVLAQVAAQAALEDLPYYQARIRQLSESKNWFLEELRGLDLPAVDTPANFVLIRFTEPDAVDKILSSKGILVRNRTRLAQLEGYLRITIGTKKEMKQVLKTLSEIPRQLVENREYEEPVVPQDLVSLQLESSPDGKY